MCQYAFMEEQSCNAVFQSARLTRTSGILYLCSLSALKFHAIAVTPNTTPSMMAVFARQFLGWAYQPPAGDQMCLGYLHIARSSAIGEISLLVREKCNVRDLSSAAHECLCGLHCCDVVCMCCRYLRRESCQSPRCISGGEVGWRSKRASRGSD